MSKTPKVRYCSECGSPFTSNYKTQLTCKSKECKKLRKNRLQRVGVERVFNCAICGTETWSIHKHAILCGSKECHKKQRTKNKIIQKTRYEKKHSYNTKENDSKRYSNKEIKTIIYMRIKGFAYAAIAKELKRNMATVSWKGRQLFKNKNKYAKFFEEVHDENFKRNMDYWVDRLKAVFENIDKQGSTNE